MKAKQICGSSKNMFGKYACSHVRVHVCAHVIPWQYHYHSLAINDHD